MNQVECFCDNHPWFPFKVRAVVDGFERIISFRPGSICEKDFHRPDSHGRSSSKIIFVLIGTHGAVTFHLSTGWYPDSECGKEKNGTVFEDLYFHSPVEKDGERCAWVKSGLCRIEDFSASKAREAFQILISKGEEELWKELEHLYYQNQEVQLANEQIKRKED